MSLNGDHGLKELRSPYEHLQARILEMIETLDDKVGRPRRRPHVKGGESWMPRRAGLAKLGLIFRVPLACALTRMRLTHPRPFGACRVRSCPKRLQAFAVFHR